jgi:hypothetical protein
MASGSDFYCGSTTSLTKQGGTPCVPFAIA